MSLKNQLVYVQFHPVAYMIKLKIELSMGALITKLARTHVNPTQDHGVSHITSRLSNRRTSIGVGRPKSNAADPGHFTRRDDLRDDLKGIHARTEIHILTEENDGPEEKSHPPFQPSDNSSSEDNLPLRDIYPRTLA
jgi:hypothetical protein